jgi:hypothetical protein
MTARAGLADRTAKSTATATNRRRNGEFLSKRFGSFRL